MRPKIPRLNPLTSKANNNFGHWKYFDDATVAAAVNLRQDLEAEIIQRPKPLKMDEKSELYLPKTANELDRCLQDFQEYTNQHKMKMNDFQHVPKIQVPTGNFTKQL